jgi:2-dehydropantoate 2-reductase
VVRMGSFAGLDPGAVEAVAACWREAGFKAEAVRDIQVMQWEKLICNVAYSAPCALTGMTVGQVLQDPELGPLSQAAAVEAWEVGRARGIAFSVTDPAGHARAFAARMPASRPSLLQDHEARRGSEIDYINGAVVRAAALAGRRAPVNEMLTALVRAKEKLFAQN